MRIMSFSPVNMNKKDLRQGSLVFIERLQIFMVTLQYKDI